MSDAEGEIQRIVDQLDRAASGDPWYGSSTRDVLAGVTAEQAAARPIPDAHTIWELVLHITAWKRELRRRLVGGPPGLPEEGDWPATLAPSDAAWAQAQAALAAAHSELVQALDSFPAERLYDVVGGQRDPATGTGVSYYAMLHGIVQHDVYHTGQIALLKKARLGAPIPEWTSKA